MDAEFKNEAEWVAKEIKSKMGFSKVLVTLDIKYGSATIKVPYGKITAGSLTISNVSTAWGNREGLFKSSCRTMNQILQNIENTRKKKYDY